MVRRRFEARDPQVGERHMSTQAAPPRYKIALLTWLGAYPVMNVAPGVLGPVTARWPLPPADNSHQRVDGCGADLGRASCPGIWITRLAEEKIRRHRTL